MNANVMAGEEHHHHQRACVIDLVRYAGSRDSGRPGAQRHDRSRDGMLMKISTARTRPKSGNRRSTASPHAAEASANHTVPIR